MAANYCNSAPLRISIQSEYDIRNPPEVCRRTFRFKFHGKNPLPLKFFSAFSFSFVFKSQLSQRWFSVS